MAIKVLFALDVEDWVDPESDDAVKRLCEIAEGVGVRWGLFVVAEKARSLVRRGRRDVIEAMARHEVCYHLDVHGPFPEPVVVYSDRLDWDDAVARALIIESRGLRDVEEIFQREVLAWCQGEANWSPQLATALARLGVPMWNGATVGADDTGPAWYCTALVLRRAPHFVSVQPNPEVPELFDSFKERFRRRVEEKGGEGFIIVFGHPTRWIFREWFLLPELGLIRQRLENRPTQITYSRPAAFSDAEIDKWFEQTEQCLRWCVEQPEVEVYSYGQFVRDYTERGLRYVRLRDIIARCEGWLGDGGRYDWIDCCGTTMSSADVFGAVSWALARYVEGGRLPDEVPLRRLLGPTYPYPETLPGPIQITGQQLTDLVRRADAAVNDTGAVPHALRLGSAAIGAGPLLLLFVETMRELARGGSWPDRAVVRPAPAYPACAEMKCFEEMAIGSHSVPEQFVPHHLRLTAKMQSWSFRPAVKQ